MIKSIGLFEGKRAVILLLEPENVVRMLEREALEVNLDELMPGIGLHLIIGAAKSEADFKRMKAEMLEQAHRQGATIYGIA